MTQGWKPACAAVFLTAVPAQAAADDRRIAYNNHCRTCHSIKPGDNRLGPTLHGIIGREAGSTDGFPFSSAMANAGIVWDEDTLDAFIANPDAVVRGHGMTPYGGITDPEVRAEIVGFLANQSSAAVD